MKQIIKSKVLKVAKLLVKRERKNLAELILRKLRNFPSYLVQNNSII